MRKENTPKGNITRTEFVIYVIIFATGFTLVFGVIIADCLKREPKEDENKAKAGQTNVSPGALGL